MENSSADEHFFRAVGHQLKSEYKEAIECYKNAIKIEPNHVRALNGNGAVFHALGDYKAAIECYNQAIKIDPNFIAAHHNKGLSLQELGENK